MPVLGRAPARRAVAVAASVVLLGAGAGMLTACAPAVAGFPPGIGATIIQQRADVAAREVQVRVRNDSGSAITVGDVTLDDPRFAGAGTRVVDRRSSLAAGASVDIRVALPEMACDAEDVGTPRVTLDLIVDGEPVTAAADVADALEVLPGIHARECLGARLAEVADVEIAAFTEAPAGEPGMLALAITPTGTGEARLLSIESTPLLTFGDGATGPYPLGIALGPEPRTVDIPVVPQRCDPHVVQEDKRGTVFTFEVDVDGVEGRIELAAAPELRARILTWVAAWCGFGG